MKTIFIYLFLFVIGFTILVAADLIAGLRLSTAFGNLLHTLPIRTPVENLLIPAALGTPFLPPLAAYLKRRRKAGHE